MRKLEVVIRRAPGALPAIAAVSLIPVLADCGARGGLAEPGPRDAGATSGGGSPTGGTGGSAAFGGSGGLILGGAGGVGATGGAGGLGGTGGSECGSPQHMETHTVSVPPPGVPAEPGQICAVSADPIESTAAARVTLTKFSPALELAQGFVAIPPALEPSVVGLPSVTVLSAVTPELQQMQVSQLTKLAGGFSFLATFPGPLSLKPNGQAWLTVVTELEIDCGPSTRKVTATTEIELCIGENDLEWVSSGDQCTVCQQVAEMAASPILPDRAPDGLPLSRAFRLRVVALAQAGESVVLLAESDGGGGLDYEWYPSLGEIERIAPDVVLWRAPRGREPRVVQVAVHGEHGAAVASFDWDGAA